MRSFPLVWTDPFFLLQSYVISYYQLGIGLTVSDVELVSLLATSVSPLSGVTLSENRIRSSRDHDKMQFH